LIHHTIPPQTISNNWMIALCPILVKEKIPIFTHFTHIYSFYKRTRVAACYIYSDFPIHKLFIGKDLGV